MGPFYGKIRIEQLDLKMGGAHEVGVGCVEFKPADRLVGVVGISTTSCKAQHISGLEKSRHPGYLRPAETTVADLVGPLLKNMVWYLAIVDDPGHDLVDELDLLVEGGHDCVVRHSGRGRGLVQKLKPST